MNLEPIRALAEKLRVVEQKLSTEKGHFLLFALFLREDAPDLWDLLVAAPWIERNKADALKTIVKEVRKVTSQKEVTTLSRIAIIEQNHPALEAIHSAMHVEHGLAEIQASTFFGLQIRHAYIITSRRKDAQPGAPGDVPRPAGSGRA